MDIGSPIGACPCLNVRRCAGLVRVREVEISSPSLKREQTRLNQQMEQKEDTAVKATFRVCLLLYNRLMDFSFLPDSSFQRLLQLRKEEKFNAMSTDRQQRP